MVGNAGLAGDFCIVSNNLWWVLPVSVGNPVF